MNDRLNFFKQWFAGFSDACGEGLSRDQWDTLRARINELIDKLNVTRAGVNEIPDLGPLEPSPMVPRRPFDPHATQGPGPLNPVGTGKLSAK